MSTVSYADGVRVLPAPTCYLCARQGVPIYARLRDRLFGAPGSWGLLGCNSCGLVWLDPRPQIEEIPKLYSEYYTHTSDAPQDASYHYWRRALKRAALSTAYGYGTADNGLRHALGRIWCWFLPLHDMIGASVRWLHAGSKGTLLDIGCGSGDFLLRMRTLGWTVKGVEPDPLARRHAVEVLGLDVAGGTLEEARFPDNSFDALTMSHVVEHLIDPVQTFSECRRILKTGGKLVVMTPNIGSLGHRWFGESWRGLEPPRHLFLFRSETLRTCAERAGLTVTGVRTTANLAPFIWQASSEIRRAGTLPGGRLQNPSASAQIAAGLFWALESALLAVRAVGEEIVLTSMKEG